MLFMNASLTISAYNPKHQVDDEDEQISRTVCWIETDAFEYAPLLGDVSSSKYLIFYMFFWN
jgi:hypothetical protein